VIRFHRIAGLLVKCLVRAETSRSSLWILNYLLYSTIPFIRGHRLRVTKVTQSEVQVSLGFVRRNQNHVGTLHACSSTTALEMAAGLALLRALAPQRVRPVIKSFTVEFLKPGKSASAASCVFECDQIQKHLSISDPATFEITSELLDSTGTFIARMVSIWSVGLIHSK
jgi:acyl-coenzyme A thioesterase PaaI-like protein